jgi:hypothetical protein
LNVHFTDPDKGPVCQNCWLNLGQDLEDLEEEKAKQDAARRKEKNRER